MKKQIIIFIVGMLALSFSVTAQKKHKEKNEATDTKVKVKPETTTSDKVHNVLHPRHKRHHGMHVKVKN